MLRKSMVLALAGFSGAAFAQSTFSIYGVMDANYDRVSATGANVNFPTRGRVTFNSSYIGFKGSEDLGGGLNALFLLETGFNENGGDGGFVAPTASSLGNRDVYVGLSGGFGKITAGVLSGPTRIISGKMDPNAGGTGIGANVALLGKYGGGNGVGAFDQRINNAIGYISPTWTGFNVAVGYVPNENRGTDAVLANTQANTTGWTLGTSYEQGPIYAALSWTQLKDANGDSAASQMKAGPAIGIPGGPFSGTQFTRSANTRAAAKYDFGNGTVGLMWDRTTSDLSTGGGVSTNQTVWYLPVTFDVGRGKIIAQYGRADNIAGSFMSVGKPGNSKDYSARHFELGYEHSLSKRTLAKVQWSLITNGTDARYDFHYGVSSPNATTVAAGTPAGADPRGLSVGIRHLF